VLLNAFLLFGNFNSLYCMSFEIGNGTVFGSAEILDLDNFVHDSAGLEQ